MAANKTQSSSSASPQYHVTDPHGNHMVLQALGSTGNITIGTATNFAVLSRQNAADLLAAFTAFANTGAIPQ
jgi:hypothetical protein